MQILPFTLFIGIALTKLNSSSTGFFTYMQTRMNLESGHLYIQSINLQIKLSLHTLTPSFRPHYRAIIIDRVRQRAISCEGRSEGLVINQLDSDEDLPSPPVINTHQGETQQYTGSQVLWSPLLLSCVCDHVYMVCLHVCMHNRHL